MRFTAPVLAAFLGTACEGGLQERCPVDDELRMPVSAESEFPPTLEDVRFVLGDDFFPNRDAAYIFELRMDSREAHQAVADITDYSDCLRFDLANIYPGEALFFTAPLDRLDSDSGDLHRSGPFHVKAHGATLISAYKCSYANDCWEMPVDLGFSSAVVE